MSASDATTPDPETMEPDLAEEQAEEQEEEDNYDFPMPGGLRGLV